MTRVSNYVGRSPDEAACGVIRGDTVQSEMPRQPGLRPEGSIRATTLGFDGTVRNIR